MWRTAVTRRQSPKLELACIEFRFLETIVRNATRDGRNGSTLYFADESIRLPFETNESKHSKICSLHFRREDFSRMFTALPGQEKLSSPRFMADDPASCVFLTIPIRQTTLNSHKENGEDL